MTTMVSFRIDEEELAAADRWAAALGIERSELLRDALAAHLARLDAQTDADVYAAEPLTDDELAFIDAEEWGPAEDWSDWSAWLDERAGRHAPR